MCDEAQQEAALSDLAILGALSRKCLVLRLGDSKQTSGGTVRYVWFRINLRLAFGLLASRAFLCLGLPCFTLH